LVYKANDVWGFGPYQSIADGLWAFLAVLAALGLAVVIGRHYGWSRAGRGLVPLLTLAGLAVTIWTGVQVGLVSNPTPSPHPSPLAIGGARKELVRATLLGADGLNVRDTVWPNRGGLNGVWLSRGLTVRGVTVAGRDVRFRRVAGGWILFARTTRPGTLTYQGNPVTVIDTRYPFPVVANFADGNGALLTDGGWYPLTPAQVRHPDRPPVMRFGLNVSNLGPWHALSNVGTVSDGRTHWRRTTGLELLAGTFLPSRFPGFTIWAGPTEAAVWDGSSWDITTGVDAAGGFYRHYVYGGAARFFGAAGAGGNVPVVGLPWWAGPAALLPLGNPNPLRPLAPYGVIATVPMPGTIGLLGSAGRQYFQAGFMLGGVALVSQWATWSPEWLGLGGPQVFVPPPAYQVPAIHFLAFSVAGKWTAMNGVIGDGGCPYASITSRAWRDCNARLDRLQEPIYNVPASRRVAVFRRFLTMVRGGHWPTWAEVDRLVQSTHS
jgi:hypothetical protein